MTGTHRKANGQHRSATDHSGGIGSRLSDAPRCDAGDHTLVCECTTGGCQSVARGCSSARTCSPVSCRRTASYAPPPADGAQLRAPVLAGRDLQSHLYLRRRVRGLCRGRPGGVIGALIAIATIATSARARLAMRWCAVTSIDRRRARERCHREAGRIEAPHRAGAPAAVHRAAPLVEEIERTARPKPHASSSRILLEHFVLLASASSAASMPSGSSAATTCRSRSRSPTTPGRSATSRDPGRRMRHREECLQRIDRLADELRRSTS
jgi:hypothetical protein